MSRSESIQKLVSALGKARAAMKPVVRDAQNPHFRSSYATLSAVLEACEPALQANGLAVVQTPQWADGGMTLETLMAHDSGEWVLSVYPIIADLSRPQLIGSAVTYSRRYAYMSIVGVAPEDDDAEAASGRGNGHASRPTPPPKPEPSIAEQNRASRKYERGGPHYNQPKEAPPGWGSNGTNGTNGHAKPEPPAREIGERVPTSGKGLWRWAAEIERLQGPGLIKHMTERAKGRPDWPDKIVNWSAAQVAEAFEDAEAALELIYDPHADAGDDYDETERDYN